VPEEPDKWHGPEEYLCTPPQGVHRGLQGRGKPQPGIRFGRKATRRGVQALRAGRMRSTKKQKKNLANGPRPGRTRQAGRMQGSPGFGTATQAKRFGSLSR